MYNGSMESGCWRGAGRVSLLALGCALVGAALLIIPAWAQPRRKGKVVRVERSRTKDRNPVRICPTPTGAGQSGTCYGTPPQRGERAYLFDYDENYLGTLTVETAQAKSGNKCHQGTVFEFTHQVQLARAGQGAVPFAVAVFGMELDTQKARVITNPPDSSAFQPEKANPWMGVDFDGDGNSEMVVTAYDCSDEETPPAPSGGQSYESYCLDYWHRDGARWQKGHRDIFYTCG